MVAIRLEQVEKRLGGRVVLRSIDAEFPAGRVTALVGPSGSGKTTLLRILAGLETADRGSVWWNERDVTHWPAHRRNVAMAFQQFVLFPAMRIEQNLEFARRYGTGAPFGDRDRREVRCLAEQLGIDHLLDRYPHELSGGEQQRVALGRVLASQADVVLLDEPLAHLDAPRRIELQRVVARWQRERGVTMVYVTHDGSEAIGLADEVVVLSAGEVVESGEARRIVEQPQQVETARLVGDPPANVVTVTASGRTTTVAIRPEEIRLVAVDAQTEPGSVERGTWRWAGRVVDCCRAISGQLVWVAVTTADGPKELLVSVTDSTWRIGDDVRVIVAPERAARLMPSRDRSAGNRAGQTH